MNICLLKLKVAPIWCWWKYTWYLRLTFWNENKSNTKFYYYSLRNEFFNILIWVAIKTFCKIWDRFYVIYFCHNILKCWYFVPFRKKRVVYTLNAWLKSDYMYHRCFTLGWNFVYECFYTVAIKFNGLCMSLKITKYDVDCAAALFLL